MKLNFAIILLALAINTGCNVNNKSDDNDATSMHEVIVKEILQAKEYTYLLVDENGHEKWIAGPKMVATVGAKYFYDSELEMNEFESKDLGKVFDQVFFVDALHDKPKNTDKSVSPHMKSPHGSPHSSGRVKVDQKEGIHLEKLSDVTSVADVYANKKELNGEPIKVQGIVVKINEQIMDRDWVHIQDGTGEGETCDLTITTKEIGFNLGDTVVCIGKLAADKDFGYGYAYPVIIESGVFEVYH